MEVNLEPKFGQNILFPNFFHMVRTTVVNHMLTIYCAGTVRTVPMAVEARTKYDSGRKIDGDETGIV